jgi:hypothetical protein
MTAVLGLGQTGLIFALPVFLQAVRHMDAFQTGIALLPMSLALLIMSPISAILGRKLSPKMIVVLGLGINVISYLILRQELTATADVWSLAPGLALFGIGFGFVIAQVNNITLSAVPVTAAGEASGVNNTMRQVGSSLGSAIMGTVLISVLTTQLTAGIQASTVLPAAAKQGMEQAVSQQASAVEFGTSSLAGSNMPQAMQDEVQRIAADATVEANHVTLLYGALFALAGFLIGLFLPSQPRQRLAHAPEMARNPEPSVAIAPALAPSHALSAATIGELILLEQKRLARGLPGIHQEIHSLIGKLRAEEERMLTTGTIAELIALEQRLLHQGKNGIHHEIRSLIERLEAEIA